MVIERKIAAGFSNKKDGGYIVYKTKEQALENYVNYLYKKIKSSIDFKDAICREIDSAKFELREVSSSIWEVYDTTHKYVVPSVQIVEKTLSNRDPYYIITLFTY
jgi:hypothetical protein